jgi:NADH:ubiquinone oxidoreductase subunit 5 (subunit L)/multisubunit Na+/H+ antiporter MnhA subunit
VGVLGYLTVKWVSIYCVSVLFKNERAFHLFSTKSAKTANLFLAPFAVLCLFVYLNYGYSIETVTKLMYVLVTVSVFAKLSTYNYMRKEKLMDVFYFILYLCIFEIVPILWILIGLDC